MCRMRLSYRELDSELAINTKHYFADEFTRLDEFVEDDLITVDDDGFKVTPRGRHFVRNIAMIFDAYLPKIQQEATEKRPVFSRTI